MKESWEEMYEGLDNGTPCKGHNCTHTTTTNETVEMRYDAYGIPTGYYCAECYENNYPYRKDNYYDPSFAGERMDDDY